jgi:hypothetical protein
MALFGDPAAENQSKSNEKAGEMTLPKRILKFIFSGRKN